MRSFTISAIVTALSITAASAMAASPEEIFGRPTPEGSTALPMRVAVNLPGAWREESLEQVTPHYVIIGVSNAALNMNGTLRIKNDFPQDDYNAVLDLCAGVKEIVHNYWVFTEYEDCI